MATEVGSLTLKVDTGDVRRAKGDVDKLSQSAGNLEDEFEDVAGAAKTAGDAADDFGAKAKGAIPPNLPAAANDAGDRLGGMGRKAGMAGIQFEQLAGQIAAGQNPMRAVGVQAADLGFVLGVPLLGAVVGIGAAIGSVLIPAMMGAEKSAEDLSDSMEEIGKIMSVNAKTGADELSASFVRLAERSRDLAELQLRVSLVEAMRNATAASAIMSEGLNDLRVNFVDLGVATAANSLEVSQNNSSMRLFTQTMGVTKEQAIELQGAIDALRAGNEGASQSFISLVSSLIDGGASGAFVDLAGPVLSAALNLKTAEEQAAFLEATLGDLDGALKTATDSSNGFADSQNAAASALQEMLRLNDDAHQKSLNREADRIAKMQKLLDKGRITQEEFEAAKTEIERAGTEERAKIREQDYEKRQKELEAAYIAEQEARAIADEEEIQAVYEKERKKQQARAIADEAEIQAAYEKERKKQEAAEARAEGVRAIENVLLKDRSEKEKAAFALSMGLMDAEKRENAKKIMSDSYSAAMSAYKALAGIPVIGPALGAAAAAAILTTGAQFAAQSLAGRALGGQVRPGESYVVGERGPEILTMGSNGGSITPNEAISSNSSQVVSKTANVSFNIQANDTEGFDELLIQRRGLIINVINEALNDQGKAAIA